ncbi:MAG: DUF86 domain-containing protein [Nitrospirae bacterium]|nr:DUF86 domain-containing protein [Nitrospirota bacterium]
MSNLKVIENKKSSIRKYLKILQRYKKYAKKEIEDDIDIRGAMERYLYLAIQSTIDLAEAIIAYKNFRKPTTMTEVFYILNEEGLISGGLTKELAKMVGFRNVIAHDYEKIDYDIVLDVLQNKLKDIEIFLKEISKKLKLV